MGAALGEHVQNTRVSEEDAGRHCGRRGHLPSVSLEDANRLIEIYIFFNWNNDSASSKRKRERCARLPQCLPASSTKTLDFL